MPVIANPTIDLASRAIALFYTTDGAAIFACIGNPNNVVVANKRSVALSDDGNIYYKTTDGVASGWIAFNAGIPTTAGQNFVYAGPGSGGGGTPAFRLLVANDMPLAAGSGVSFSTAFGILTISATGSITINPTDGAIPVRTNSTTFGDSNITINGTSVVITSANAAALAVGRQGATNPAWLIDASVANCATGIKETSRAANGGVELLVISTANDEAIKISGKGNAGVHLNKASGGSASVHIGIPTNAMVGLRIDAGGGSADIAQWSQSGNVSNGSYSGVASQTTCFVSRTADTINPGATVTLDMRAGNVRNVTLAGNGTLTVSNLINSVIFVVTLVQDATGTRTVTWNSAFKFPSGVAPTLSVAAGARDVFTFFTDGTNCYLMSQALDVR